MKQVLLAALLASSVCACAQTLHAENVTKATARARSAVRDSLAAIGGSSIGAADEDFSRSGPEIAARDWKTPASAVARKDFFKSPVEAGRSRFFKSKEQLQQEDFFKPTWQVKDEKFFSTLGR